MASCWLKLMAAASMGQLQLGFLQAGRLDTISPLWQSASSRHIADVVLNVVATTVSMPY
jgi:hypothetical protein